MKILQVIFILLAIGQIVQPILFKRQTNSLDSSAICIDGSPSFYYLSDHNPQANGLIIYFINTPQTTFCGSDSISSSLEKCLTIRDQISSYWTNTLQITEGMLADVRYKDWDKVIIPNCDGTLFQGNSDIKYKNKDFYLRGSVIVKSSFSYLFGKKYDVKKYQNIVMAGNEYGAIGALIWSGYFYDNFVLNSGRQLKYSLIVDSIPHGYKNFKTSSNVYQSCLENLLKLTPIQPSHPFQLCALQNYQQQWQCFRISEEYKFITFPILLIDSQYDQATITDNIGIYCINQTSNSLGGCSKEQRSFLEEYRSKKLLFLYEFVNFRENSVWSTSCSAHSFLLSSKFEDANWKIDKIDKINNNKLSGDVSLFVDRIRVTEFDNFGWPSNVECSGTA